MSIGIWEAQWSLTLSGETLNLWDYAARFLKGFWREQDNIFRRDFSSYIRWSWILGDHLAHRKAINGASIRMGTSRDQRFFYFVHKFLVFKFLSQTCSLLILQQVILAHFMDEKMEIQVSINWCYFLAIGASVWAESSTSRHVIQDTAPLKFRIYMNPLLFTKSRIDIRNKPQRVTFKATERNTSPLWEQKMDGTHYYKKRHKLKLHMLSGTCLHEFLNDRFTLSYLWKIRYLQGISSLKDRCAFLQNTPYYYSWG